MVSRTLKPSFLSINIESKEIRPNNFKWSITTLDVNSEQEYRSNIAIYNKISGKF